VYKPAKILAKCGAKQVERITSGEKGITTRAICAVSAYGVFIPTNVNPFIPKLNCVEIKIMNSIIFM